VFGACEPTLLPRRTRKPLNAPETRGVAPQSFLTIVRRALVAYVLDSPLYIAVALVGLGILYVVGMVLPAATAEDRRFALSLCAIVVVAFINATVYVGTTARDSGIKRSWLSTLDRALEVLWAVVIIDFIANTLVGFTNVFVFGTPEQTGFGIFGVPVALLWTAITFPEAAAAIDGDDANVRRVSNAIVHGVRVAFRPETFGRLVLITAVTTVPIIFLQRLIMDAIGTNAATSLGMFLEDIPLDLVTTGLVSAVVGVAYRDLRSREPQQPKN
jgi:hypothetical protein